MKADGMIEQLEAAATQLGVRVSYELLAATVGHGGLCRVRGEYRVIIDKRATPQERLTTLASALTRFDTASLKLSTKLRNLLEFYSTDNRAPTRHAS
jgi:hypothetical protein